jgi:asparagine synthase (glutamine-hydrolysing)
MLNGMFSFVLYDSTNDDFYAVRDPTGITTLYQGWGENGTIWFCSEMKGLVDHCHKIISFPPGCFYSSKTGTTTQYYTPTFYKHLEENYPSLDDELVAPSDAFIEQLCIELRVSLEKSVKRHLMSEVPFGVLLSGGLDSSLIASIAMRSFRQDEETDVDDDIRCILFSFSCIFRH